MVQTVAVVGYAASGLWGGLLAAAVAFTPSFVFVIAGASHFDRLRTPIPAYQAFFIGAGSAVIGSHRGAGNPARPGADPPVAACGIRRCARHPGSWP